MAMRPYKTPIPITAAPALLRLPFFQICLQRYPVVRRPAFGDAFVVMLRNPDVNQVDPAASQGLGKVHNQN